MHFESVEIRKVRLEGPRDKQMQNGQGAMAGRFQTVSRRLLPRDVPRSDKDRFFNLF